MRTPFQTHEVPATAGSDVPAAASTNHHWNNNNGNASNGHSPGEEAVQNGAAIEPRRPNKRGFRKLLPKLPRVSLNSAYRTVTLSVEKDVARVVVFKGRKITAWGSAPLEAATPAGDDPENLGAFSQPSPPLSNLLDQLGIRHGGRWRDLLDQLGMRSGRVVMDFTLYTTLMRFLQVPRIRGRYFEPMVVSEVLEAIPFDEDEVDITWHLLKGSDSQSVFAVSLPKEKVDRQVRLLKEGGLIPAAAYSKANVLALAAGVPSAIVVHLEPTQAAIVLINNGAPQVVHQLEFGDQGSTPEDQSDGIARAIDQVAGYDQNIDLGEQSDRLPVIFTGKNSAADSPVAQILRSTLSWEVHPFAPPLQYPEDFPLEEYATNMGLFLADRVEGRNKREDSAPSVPSLDLLPRRHRPKPLPVFQAAIFLTLALLAFHPFDFTQWVNDKQLQAQTVDRSLRDLRTQEQQHNLILARHEENQTGFDQAQAQGMALRTLQEDLNEDMDTLLTRLTIITRDAKPDYITLTTIAPLGSDWSVRGSAPTYQEALKYAADLKAYPIFEDARAIQVQGTDATGPDDEEGLVSFLIKVVLPQEEDPDAESSP